jgi:hypothetical protein
MSTRSIIAIPEGDGFKGRYCHGDGYPTWQLKSLHTVITETFNGDVEAAVNALVFENYGWSSISGEQDPPEWYANTYKNEPRFKWVPGIGCAYTTTKLDDGYQQTTDDEWLVFQGDKPVDTDTEWAYVIDTSSRRISVFKVNYIPNAKGFQKRAHYIGGFNIDTLDTSDEHLTEVECGKNFERCEHIAAYHFEEANTLEFNRLSTQEWLGLSPIDTTDFTRASAVLYYGRRLRLTGSGSCPRRVDPYTRQVTYDWRYWDALVIDDETGESFDLRIARRFKTVPPKPAKGVEWVFPQPPAVRAGV